MPPGFLQHGLTALLPPNAVSGVLSASALPLALSYPDAARIITNAGLSGPDLKTENAGLWVTDPSAEFGPAPPREHIFISAYTDGKWGLKAAGFYTMKAGRSMNMADIVLPDMRVSGFHMLLSLFPDLVSIINVSERKAVYIGGGYLDPGQRISIMLDTPFLVGLKNPLLRFDGSLIIGPADAILKGAFELSRHGPLFHLSPRRKPWHEITASARNAVIPAPSAVQPQTLSEDGSIITPLQIRGIPDSFGRVSDILTEEPVHIRASVKRWIAEGRLTDHVKGRHGFNTRLLANVRKGGMLLPTHSTGLKAALDILKSGTIDPQFSRRRKAFFRYGLGHSYGEIVFIQKPGTEGLGALNDIWNVLKNLENAPEELYRLVANVDFNRHVPLKVDHEPPAADDGRFEGRTHYIPSFNDHALMELLPQFESYFPVSIENTYAILVPDHLYDKLVSQVPPHRHHLLIRIPGTGRTEGEFLAGRDKIARRSRKEGGSFEPKVGFNALFRYELTYFKLVEMVLRTRHQMLRQKVEKLADEAKTAGLSHAGITAKTNTIIPLLPEAYRLLHHQKQFPSHDGLSPLEHILNTLVEAAYLAPAIANEFPSANIRDVFLALLFHDLGKMFGATNRNHDRLSIELARYHLKMMGIGEETEADRTRQKRILEFIEHAGLISEVSMARDKGGEDYKQVAARVLPQIGQYLPEKFMMNFADAAAIPGRSGRKMQVYRDYTPIDVRRNIIQIFRMLQKPF